MIPAENKNSGSLLKELNKELITILKTYNKDSFLSLRDFIQSPYFHRGIKLKQSIDQLSRLLDFIEENINNAAQLNRPYACEALFPNLSIKESEQRLNRIMTELLNMTKRFIYWEYVQNEEKTSLSEKIALLKFYYDKDLNDNFLKTAKEFDYKTEPKSDQPLVQDSKYLYNLFQIELLKGDFLTKQDAQKGELNIGDILHLLDCFYTSQAIELLCYSTNRKKDVKEANPPTASRVILHNMVIEFVKTNNIDNPLINAFDKIITLLKEELPEKNQIIELEDYLLKNQERIPKVKFANMVAYVRNFWVYRNDKLRNSETLTDLYHAYKKHWNEGKPNNLWEKEGVILPNIIQNAVNIALQLHSKTQINNENTEYSIWVEELLKKLKGDEYKIHNKDGDKQEILDLSWARYYLQFKAYDKVEKYALLTKYNNPFRVANANIILIEVYYYTQPDRFDDALSNFRIWLTKHKDISETKKNVIRKSLIRNIRGFGGDNT